MSKEPADLRAVLSARVPIPEAIRASLPISLAEFARKYGFARPNVSDCIRGRQRHERVRAALAAELAVEREWLDALLDGQRGAAKTDLVAVT